MGNGQWMRMLTLPTLQFGNFLSEGWSAARGESSYRGVPPVERSLLTVAEASLDQTFTLAVNLLTGVPHPDQVRLQQRELAEAVALHDAHGWLNDPASFHETPPQLDHVSSKRVEGGFGSRRVSYDDLSFESRFRPHRNHPGADRWLEFDANHTARAYAMEHPESAGPRPWLVCIHGFSMGDPASTFSGFGARHLHEDLGLNLLFPVLPLHGPRTSARFSGGDMLSPDYMNVVHTFQQSVWDIRRLLSWLRGRGAESIGLYGISLGAYNASLVSGLEDGLDFLLGGIPAVDFPTLARDNQPWILQAYGAEPSFEIDWAQIGAVTRVVSPLAFEPRVPKDRRFIYAATADRVARPDQARALWRHWDQPEIHWAQSGHVIGMWKSSVARFVDEALKASLLSSKPPRRRKRNPRPAASTAVH